MSAALDGRRVAAVRAAAVEGECRELGLLRAAGGSPDSLLPLDREARMEVLKALGFSKLGVRLAIIAALPAPSDATSAASARNGDPDEMISHCPGSRWRVVHNLLVLCVPSFEEDTSSPMTRSINMGSRR